MKVSPPVALGSRRPWASRSPAIAAIPLAAALAGAIWILGWGQAQEPTSRPLILLTNDDGIGADGLKAVAAALSRIGDVIIAAPSQNWSGASQCLKLGEPIRVRKLEAPQGSGLTAYAIDGPPATCVTLAVEHLTGGRKLDLVVSGINRGENLGLDVSFSGTVGGARAGAELGLPAIACSLALGSREFEAAAGRVREIVLEALERKLAPGRVLCVNFPRTPPAEWKRIQLTALGGRGFQLTHELKSSIGPDTVYEPQLLLARGPFPEGSDTKAVADGYISVCAIPIVGGAGKPPEDLRAWKIFQ